MKTTLLPLSGILVLFCLILMVSVSCEDAVAPGQPAVFNDGWRFMLAELDESAAAPSYDDSDWDAIRLPHDWAIAGPFDPNGDGSTGKLPWRGVGWYRNTFTIVPEDAGKQVYFDFDGVMAFPTVYINGEVAGS